jgi:hypothetical protein
MAWAITNGGGVVNCLETSVETGVGFAGSIGSRGTPHGHSRQRSNSSGPEHGVEQHEVASSHRDGRMQRPAPTGSLIGQV